MILLKTRVSIDYALKVFMIFIKVGGINEDAPSFNLPVDDESMAETSPVGSVVYTCTAVDTDYSPHGIIGFTINSMHKTVSESSIFQLY